MVNENKWRALAAELSRQRNEANDRLAEAVATIAHLNAVIAELQEEQKSSAAA